MEKDRKNSKENEEIITGKGIFFERTRRITGYLVDSIDRFGNAKRAEEKNRIKHTGVKT